MAERRHAGNYFKYSINRKTPEEIVDDMTLFDDVLMCKVFDGNVSATELLLQTILGKRIKVVSVKGQSTLQSPLMGGRTITLDIKAEDSQGDNFNIEVQGNSSGVHIRRARFHSSMLDSRMLKENDKFRDLKDSYVIFFYKHDKFRLGLPVYHIERTLLENGKKVNDGSHIIYVNGTYSGEDKIGKLISDFKSKQSVGMNFKELRKGVKKYKETEKGREIMCESVRKYGESICVETKIDDVRNLMATMKLTVNQALDALKISGDDRKIIESMLSK